MTKRGREVMVEEFKLKNKDEVVKALKDLGFTVKVEKEEERLYDEEEELKEKGMKIKLVGLFERLDAYKDYGNYCIRVVGDAETMNYVVRAERGVNDLLASRLLADPTPEELSRAVEEVVREAELKVKRWLEGVQFVTEKLKELGFVSFIAKEDRVEASCDVGNRVPTGGIRVFADGRGAFVHLQLWNLDYEKGVELVEKLVEVLRSLGFKVAPP